MDGDLDAVVAVRGAAPFLLRNNGDGTWLRTEPFAGVAGAVGFAWGDVDADGDPDAVFLDEQGDLHVFANLQAGRFEPVDGPGHGTAVAFALGEVEGDGKSTSSRSIAPAERRAARWARWMGRDDRARWASPPAAVSRGLATARSTLIRSALDNSGRA